MTLIKSISGIRGTIGGNVGEGLSPLDVVRFTAAYGTWIKQNSKVDSTKIVVGRDARLSGKMVESLVVGTLIGLGLDVVNIGLASTPTTEIAVQKEQACGGLILTASHNPKEYNGYKVYDSKGCQLCTDDAKAAIGFVNEITDGGKIILQKAVAVENGDTPETLQRRVMEQAEWILLPQAIDDIANGRIAVENGKAVRRK